MHIMINGNYLSLDNILTISNPYKDGDFFYINYNPEKTVSFYYRQNAPSDGELAYNAFYFKTKEVFYNVRNEIIKILTENATKSN